MNITLFAFGKLKLSGLRETADLYVKRVQPWVKLQEVELKPEKVADKSPELRLQIQAKESEILLDKIQRSIGPRGVIVLLDERGQNKNTLAWADHLKDWENTSVPSVAFCIGSSLGFSEELRRKAHLKLSLGAQTLSHELARVVLLEQIYRSYSVLRGHPYHNED